MTIVAPVCNSDISVSGNPAYFNDVASSLQLSSGCVRLYQDPSCGGSYVDYIGDTATLVPDNMNDVVSSFSACPLFATVTLYADINYGGELH